MSFVYSTNTPHFLDYIASCKSRNDILNDPDLCVLLEDPHVKDNMELALKARAADYGNYDDKVDFVGFFLANGPELDTDTIMHYRKKILLNYTYSRIAKEEFGDISKVDDLRVNTYGKETTASAEAKGEDDGNCFKNPCDYLQPISAMIGMLGDSENFKSIANIFARNNKESEEDKKKEKDEKKEDRPSNSVWGAIRKHTMSKIIPEFNKSYRIMLKNMGLKSEELKEKAKEANMEKETQTIGDSTAESIAENIAPAVKMNIFANMGDCARLWEYLRRLNVYDPNQNRKGPIDDSVIDSKKSVQGTPNDVPRTRNDNDLKMKSISTQTKGIGTSMGGLTKTQIVMEYLRTDYFDAEDVSAVWHEIARKYGWKDYKEEMYAHLAKCATELVEGKDGYSDLNFINPYRDQSYFIEEENNRKIDEAMAAEKPVEIIQEPEYKPELIPDLTLENEPQAVETPDIGELNLSI